MPLNFRQFPIPLASSLDLERKQWIVLLYITKVPFSLAPSACLKKSFTRLKIQWCDSLRGPEAEDTGTVFLPLPAPMSSAHPTPTPTASQKKHTSERTLPYNIQRAVSHPRVHLVILWCAHATNTHQTLTKCEALPLVVRIQRKIKWKTNLAKIFH